MRIDMFTLPQKIKSEISKYKDSLQKFLAGELKDDFFKGIRVPWGNYSQRGGKVLMSRLRIPGGILMPLQLKAIGEAAQKFSGANLHLTTRQDIQLHNVPYKNSAAVMEYLKEHNISPRGGGGNTVRNVTACYLSGVCTHEKQNVYSLAWRLSEELLQSDEAYNLPRKFKIAFSGCEKDCAYSGVNDVGFVATEDGFKVLCGGGMGAKSYVGNVLHENIKPEDACTAAKAVFNVYNAHGDRKNKHKNRLRFLIRDIGWEKFVEIYTKEYKKLKSAWEVTPRAENGLPQPRAATQPQAQEPHQQNETDAAYKNFLAFNVGKQRHDGFSYILLRIPVGELEPGKAIALSELEKDIPGIYFRVTQRQDLMLCNVPSEKLRGAYEKINGVLTDFLYPNTLYDIVSCKAATTCNLGICNAIALEPAIQEKLRALNPDAEKLGDMKININGCPNACGHHPIAALSLQGISRKVHNRTVPFYRVFVGGKINAEHTKLAEEAGAVPARAVPQFVSEFIDAVQKKADGDAEEFISTEGKTILHDLIQKYSSMPPYETDKSFYIDFGKTEEFSLSGLAPSECGAGVLDMIQSDLQSAGESLAQSKKKNFSTRETKNALTYAARALLVVKGADPKDEKEAVSLFVELFVNSGISLPEFGNLSEVYDDMLSENLTGEPAFIYTEKFYNEVKTIYSLMDANFNFPAGERHS